MRTRLMGPALGLAVALLVLAGACGGGDEDEPAGLGTDTAEPQGTGASDGRTPEDDPAEAPADDGAPAEPVEHVFPEAGVTVTEPPASTDAEAAAMGVYVQFLRDWRLSLREVRLDDSLSTLALPPVIQTVQSSLDYQEEHGIRYSGEMVVTPRVEQSGSRVIVIGGCMDVSALTIVDDGEERPIDGIEEHPVKPIRVVVADDGTGWKINENTVLEEESC